MGILLCIAYIHCNPVQSGDYKEFQHNAAGIKLGYWLHGASWKDIWLTFSSTLTHQKKRKSKKDERGKGKGEGKEFVLGVVGRLHLFFKFY